MRTLVPLSLVALLMMGVCQQAKADSIGYGAISRCAPREGVFELGAYVRFNEQITVGLSNLSRAKVVPFGTHKIKCDLGGHQSVIAEVEVLRAASEHCMGAGSANLKRLLLNGKQVLGGTEVAGGLAGCYIDSETVLVRAMLRKWPSGGLMFTQCYSPAWQWETGYPDVTCSTKQLPD